MIQTTIAKMYKLSLSLSQLRTNSGCQSFVAIFHFYFFLHFFRWHERGIQTKAVVFTISLSFNTCHFHFILLAFSGNMEEVSFHSIFTFTCNFHFSRWDGGGGVFPFHFHFLLVVSLFTFTFPGEMEEEVSDPKAFLTSLRPFTNFTLTVAPFTKWVKEMM